MSTASTRHMVTRRDVLKWMSAGAGAAATCGGVWLVGEQIGEAPTPNAAAPASTMRPRAAPQTTVVAAADDSRSTLPAGGTDGPAMEPVAADRMLVVIELEGGNDGLSTLVPYGIGRYYDLRSTTSIPAEQVLALDGSVGLHPNLVRMKDRGLAIVQGVGSPTPDLSHFEMQRRWWAGDPSGSLSLDTGVLGRLADVVGDPSVAASAVSLGSANHPILASRVAGTLSLPGLDAAGYLVGATEDDVLRYAFQRGLGGFTTGPAGGSLGRSRFVGAQAIGFADRLMAMGSDDADEDGVSDSGVEYPGSPLGQGLRFAARLLASEQGVRIVHVPMNASFDTHDDHVGQHPQLMATLDEAVDAFLRDMEARGMAERVLVMTISEFGRRVPDNGSAGLDHGTASVGLLLGPVTSGLFGEHPSLDDLDDDNLRATVGFDQYFATVAEGWFGVPSSELFSSAPMPLTGLF
jgi:uncharacterized protein (DUF1501 family)